MGGCEETFLNYSLNPGHYGSPEVQKDPKSPRSYIIRQVDVRENWASSSLPKTYNLEYTGNNSQ
jgi:hypothetical protein